MDQIITYYNQFISPKNPITLENDDNYEKRFKELKKVIHDSITNINNQIEPIQPHDFYYYLIVPENNTRINTTQWSEQLTHLSIDDAKTAASLINGKSTDKYKVIPLAAQNLEIALKEKSTYTHSSPKHEPYLVRVNNTGRSHVMPYDVAIYSTPKNKNRKPSFITTQNYFPPQHPVSLIQAEIDRLHSFWNAFADNYRRFFQPIVAKLKGLENGISHTTIDIDTKITALNNIKMQLQRLYENNNFNQDSLKLFRDEIECDVENAQKPRFIGLFSSSKPKSSEAIEKMYQEMEKRAARAA